MKQFFRSVCLSLLLAGCAGQRPPEGGPVDTEPPSIISVYPKPNTVQYSEKKIVIEFNEYVNRRSVEEAVFISPAIDELEFDWSGTEVEISFPNDLRANTTYVVTIGTDVTDVRAGNRMAQTFSLSFSTGSTIDAASISGSVSDEQPVGVLIYSYRLDSIRADTLNPSVTKPDYLTQTGKDGSFTLRNLAFGTYRVVAVRDDYRNLLYEPEVDAVGTTDDVTLTKDDSVRSGLSFIITKRDTTAPKLMTATPSDNRHLLVQFSEPLDPASVTVNSFQISDTLATSFLPVTTYFFTGDKRDKVMLVTDRQLKDSLYLLSVRSVRDAYGFVINPLAAEKQFVGSGVNDTIPPTIVSASVSAALGKIFPGDSIVLSFNDALQCPIADSALYLRRGKDSSVVATRHRMADPASLYILPAERLRAGETMSLYLRPNTLSDLFGNKNSDSTVMLKIEVDDPEQYGSIAGMAAGYPSHRTVILAHDLSNKKQKPAQTTIDSIGAFVLSRLPEGQYRLKMFDDVSGNKTHDAGDVYPFLRGERFSFYKDTIRVRARWPVDGVYFLAK